MMGTKTLVKNLRKAIAEDDRYHIALYGEEACRRLLQQKRALDAFESQREAARTPDADKPDTEPAAEQTGPQERTCGSCRWWCKWSWSNDAGDCRRYPEAIGALDTGWCGEWQETEEEADRRLAESIREEARRKAKLEDMWAKEDER